MRLIDADALKTTASIQRANFNTIETIRQWIDEAPTIDAVPVVRCKDCVHFETGDWCVLTGARAREDGYCAWGERKVEEED